MTAEQGSPTTSAGNSLLDELPDVFAGGAAWEYVAAIEREARQQALTDAIAAVEAESVWSIPTGDYVDRAAVIDTLTRLRDGS